MDHLFKETKTIIDARGALVALEQEQDIVPFKIKRVYYLYDLIPDKPRGFHAHKTLEQAMICLRGSCTVHMDNAKNKQDFILSKPYQILRIPPHYWHSMSHFSDDALLLMLASDHYDENDYIRNYDDFLAYNTRRKEE